MNHLVSTYNPLASWPSLSDGDGEQKKLFTVALDASKNNWTVRDIRGERQLGLSRCFPSNPFQTEQKKSLIVKQRVARSIEEEERVYALFKRALEKQPLGLVPFVDVEKEDFAAEFQLSSLLKEVEKMQFAQIQFYDEWLFLLNASNRLMDKGLQEGIIDRLTPTSFIEAILTAEFQLYDLHSKNIAFSPIPNDAFERFKSQSFAYFDQRWRVIDFKDLLELYLSQKISQDTQIIYMDEKKQEVQSVLKNVPNLLTALDVPWKLTLFDVDGALCEGNDWGVQLQDEERWHNVQIQSALLETPLCDKPLDESVIKYFSERAAIDQRLEEWVNKSEGGVWQALSKEQQKQLTDLLTPFLEQKKYALSEYREKEPLTTIEYVQKQFAQDLAHESSHAIWQWLKKEGGAAFEDIIDNQEKRYAVALDLHPRLSWLQRKALKERQERRLAYFKNMQALKVQEKMSLDEIRHFVESSIGPLNSLQKQAYLETLNEETIESMRKEILVSCRPTYFNVLKVMYPLLADVHELYKLVYGNGQVGFKLGSYEYPFEHVLQKLKQEPSLCTEQVKILTNSLQKRLEEVDSTLPLYLRIFINT
jgi:hypothetical protein